MLIFVQFPITDIRRFNINSPAIISSPFWPAPVAYREFMRSSGLVKERRRGGITGWVGENEICDVSRAVQFSNPISINSASEDSKSTKIKNLASYFYSDGLALGKYDIVLKQNRKNISWSPHTIAVSLKTLGNQNISIHVGNEKLASRFFAAGKLFAQHYLFASSYTRDYGQLSDKWIFGELPLVYLELDQDEYIQFPRASKYSLLSEELGIEFGSWWIEWHDSNIPVWLLHYPTQHNTTNYVHTKRVSRSLRLYIMRLHAEYHVLRRVLRCIEDETIQIEGNNKLDILQQYFNNATRRINRINTRAVSHDTELIEEMAYSSLELISPGQGNALIQKLQTIRPTILKKLQRLVNKFTFVEEIDMSKKIEINVNDSAKLELTNSDFIIADQITQLHEATEHIENQQLRTVMRELVLAVQQMSRQLSEEKQKELAQELEILNSESQKKEPDMRRWKFSIEGLKQAAEDIGEIGKPVIELASKIAGILMIAASNK